MSNDTDADAGTDTSQSVLPPLANENPARAGRHRLRVGRPAAIRYGILLAAVGVVFGIASALHQEDFDAVWSKTLRTSSPVGWTDDSETVWVFEWNEPNAIAGDRRLHVLDCQTGRPSSRHPEYRLGDGAELLGRVIPLDDGSLLVLGGRGFGLLQPGETVLEASQPYPETAYVSDAEIYGATAAFDEDTYWLTDESLRAFFELPVDERAAALARGLRERQRLDDEANEQMLQILKHPGDLKPAGAGEHFETTHSADDCHLWFGRPRRRGNLHLVPFERHFNQTAEDAGADQDEDSKTFSRFHAGLLRIVDRTAGEHAQGDFNGQKAVGDRFALRCDYLRGEGGHNFGTMIELSASGRLAMPGWSPIAIAPYDPIEGIEIGTDHPLRSPTGRKAFVDSRASGRTTEIPMHGPSDGWYARQLTEATFPSWWSRQAKERLQRRRWTIDIGLRRSGDSLYGYRTFSRSEMEIRRWDLHEDDSVTFAPVATVDRTLQRFFPAQNKPFPSPWFRTEVSPNERYLWVTEFDLRKTDDAPTVRMIDLDTIEPRPDGASD